MAVSNTYIEPTAGTTLNTARGQINASLRAVLTNFKGPSNPTGPNIKASGVDLGELDGMLYRSSRTNALYISDTANKKNTVAGGNFTRWGVGHRVEPSLAVLNTNNTSYEIGELVATMDTARLYFRNSNTNNLNSFIDVGAPQGYVTEGPFANAVFSGQNVTATRFLATSNVGVGTGNPKDALDITGNAYVSVGIYIGDYLSHIGDTNTKLGFPQADTITLDTNGTEKIRVDLVGNLGINTTTAKSRLEVSGNAYISTQLTIGTTANIIGALGVTGLANVAGGATIIGNTYVRQNVVVSGNVVTAGIKFTGASNVYGEFNSANGITASASADAVSAGNYTPSYISGNMKTLTNNSVFNFNAPTAAGNYTMVVQITNGATPGIITMTSFSKVLGDAFTVTVGDDFFVYITKLNGFTMANIVALQ